MFARIKVVLSSVVTYLIAAGVGVAVLTDQVAQQLPAGWQDNAVQAGGVVIAAIASAVAVLRRVIEAVPDSILVDKTAK